MTQEGFFAFWAAYVALAKEWDPHGGIAIAGALLTIYAVRLAYVVSRRIANKKDIARILSNIPTKDFNLKKQSESQLQSLNIPSSGIDETE